MSNFYLKYSNSKIFSLDILPDWEKVFLIYKFFGVSKCWMGYRKY